MKELIRIYKESKSPLEKANIWSHILEKLDEQYDYIGSLYFNENEAIDLNNPRDTYKRGYIQALNDLIF